MSAKLDDISQENFLHRVKDLPVVNAGVEQAWSMYEKYMFNAVSTLNTLACSGLTMAEKRYPSIHKQPAEIKEDYVNAVNGVKAIPGNVLTAITPTMPKVPKISPRESIAQLNRTSRERVANAAQTLLSIIDYADGLVDGYVAADDDVVEYNKEHDYASVSGVDRVRLITNKVARGVKKNSAKKLQQINETVVISVDDAKKVLRLGAQNVAGLPNRIYYISPNALLMHGVQAWVGLLSTVSDKSLSIVPMLQYVLEQTNQATHHVKEGVDEADTITSYTSSTVSHYGKASADLVVGLGHQGVEKTKDLTLKGLEKVNDVTNMGIEKVIYASGKSFEITKQTAELTLGMTILAMESAARLPVIRDMIIRANQAIEKEKKM